MVPAKACHALTGGRYFHFPSISLGMEDLQKAIGDRVRKWRKSKGFTQEAFQEHCRIGGRGQMSNIERGKLNISLDTLEKLAHNGFRMTVARFLSGLEKEPIKKPRQKGQPE